MSQIPPEVVLSGSFVSASVVRSASLPLPELMLALVGRASEFAIVPTSDFPVGAVVAGKSGALYFGANLEIAGRPLTGSVHAEQAAVNHAWLSGETGIVALASSVTPCGYCRQFLYELADAERLPIYLPDYRTVLGELLPRAFGPQNLGLEGNLMSPSTIALDLETSDPLVEFALEAARRSYAPYTKTVSGAAVETLAGTRFAGRLAENAAYNPTLDPVLSALSFAAMQGHSPKDIARTVVVTAKENSQAFAEIYLATR